MAKKYKDVEEKIDEALKLLGEIKESKCSPGTRLDPHPESVDAVQSPKDISIPSEAQKV